MVLKHEEPIGAWFLTDLENADVIILYRYVGGAIVGLSYMSLP